MQKITDNLETIFKNPYLIYKIIKNYSRIALKKPVLGAVELAVTYDCNLTCSYCSSTSLYQKNRPYLTLEEIKMIIVELINRGAFVINLTGGEPFLREDIFDIICFIKNKRILATILTNGYLLTRECVSKLKKASVDAIQISINEIDGNSLREESSDAFLNRELLLGIENAKLAGLKVVISTIITNENINSGEIKEIIKFCKSIRSVLNLIVPCAVGKWGGRCDKLLTEESWRVFQGLCKIKGIRTDTHMNYFGRLCPAGTERVYISAYGDVLPCDFIHISFGNLKRENLKSILERIRIFPPIKNKKTPCLAGKDPDFIKKYLNYTQDKKSPFSYMDL